MDIQDSDYYSANTFVHNEVGDIAWEKIQEKNRSNLVCCENSFSKNSFNKNSYHIETSQLIWVVNQLTDFYMMGAFTEGRFRTGYNFAIDESFFFRQDLILRVTKSFFAGV